MAADAAPGSHGPWLSSQCALGGACSVRGLCVSPLTLTGIVRAAAKRAGVRFSPHMFGPAHVTALLRDAVDLRATAARLGHSRTSTNLNVYAHVGQAAEECAAAAAETATQRLLGWVSPSFDLLAHHQLAIRIKRHDVKTCPSRYRCLSTPAHQSCPSPCHFLYVQYRQSPSQRAEFEPILDRNQLPVPERQFQFSEIDTSFRLMRGTMSELLRHLAMNGGRNKVDDNLYFILDPSLHIDCDLLITFQQPWIRRTRFQHEPVNRGRTLSKPPNEISRRFLGSRPQTVQYCKTALPAWARLFVYCGGKRIVKVQSWLRPAIHRRKFADATKVRSLPHQHNRHWQHASFRMSFKG
jgi:hypothetical protein